MVPTARATPLHEPPRERQYDPYGLLLLSNLYHVATYGSTVDLTHDRAHMEHWELYGA